MAPTSCYLPEGCCGFFLFGCVRHFSKKIPLPLQLIYSSSRGSHDDPPRPHANQEPESPKRVAPSASQSPSSSPPRIDVPQHRFAQYSAQPQGSPPPFHALTPSNYGPAHESRRRNAEQRAANLREDPYILVVEPNRVFCKLCSKWVQLRQDSSYCAYPWMQHRQKCEARQ